MIAAGSLEYAFARMQSRLGRRPSEPLWTAIEHAREFEAVIDLARGTTLAEALHDLGEAREAADVQLEAMMAGLFPPLAEGEAVATDRLRAPVLSLDGAAGAESRVHGFTLRGGSGALSRSTFSTTCADSPRNAR